MYIFHFVLEAKKGRRKIMAMCEICGKTHQVGNRVSHAHNKTKHVFRPNIQRIRVRDKNGTVHRMYVCTRCIKSGKVTKAD